jgi:ubiquinone/menaquinone biosynthesis C-methylase UbiE
VYQSLKDVPLYYESPRNDVMPFVPEGVKSVLDIGCGSGGFGENVKLARGAEVWGIEQVAHVAEFARTRLDKVLVGDAIEMMKTIPENTFDLMTANDVLEHLAWPGLALQEAKRILKPGGRVQASLPNIRFWDAFRELAFRADFPQLDQGIYDRTHLRFFTEKSMKRFFAENGYEIERMQGVNATPSRVLRLINLFTGGKYKDCQYLQFVIVARPL